MNKFLLLTLVIASAQALACPNLTGTYTCNEVIEGKPTTYKLTIAQTPTTISLIEEGKEGDGPLSLVGPQKFVVMKMDVTSTPSCTDTEIKLVQTAAIPFYGDKVIVTSTMTKTPAGMKGVTEEPFGTQIADCKKMN